MITFERGEFPLQVALVGDYEGLGNLIPPVEGVRIEAFQEPIDPRDLVTSLESFDAVVVVRERARFDRETLSRLARLRLIVTTGTANAAIDLVAASERGITVCGTAAGGGAPAELALAFVLLIARRLDLSIETVRSGGWSTGRIDRELGDLRLGVVGLGRVGSRLATLAGAVGMTVSAWSPRMTDDRARAVGARALDLDELLATSDVVSLHLTLNEETRGMFGAPSFAKMGGDAWLVNTARAELCVESELVAACRSGEIAGAALDVHAAEPLQPDHPFRSLPNVLATPHVGFVSRRTYERWAADVADALRAFLAGEPVRLLTPPQGEI